MPKHKENHLKKLLKESKLNKNILTAKTPLEAFKPKAKFLHFKKNLFQKYVPNQFLFLKSVQYYICKN